MKKTDAEPPAETKPAETAPADPPSPVAATEPASDAGLPPVIFDDAHEWPSAGGCWVRQADGSLKKDV